MEGDRRGRRAAGRVRGAGLRRLDRIRLARNRRDSRRTPRGAPARTAALARSGDGPPVEPEVVRAMILLRARTLAMGRSGARPVVAETMLALLNAGLTPVVPEHGSLGASGDLAPLAHCALTLIRRGRARQRRRGPATGGGCAPRRRHRAPDPGAEGGPRARQRNGRHARHAGARLPRPRTAAARRGRGGGHVRRGAARTDRAFAEDLIALRPQPGQAASAAKPPRAAGRLGDRGQPPSRRFPASRTPTPCAAPRRSPAPCATRSRTPSASPPRSSSPRSTTR